jgi:phenylalanyl-tRNA synthetase beta chain
MRLLVSWLRDFVEVDATAEELAETLGLRGFEVASVEALGKGDAVIDFEVTANRPDCLSVIGLAREVATAYDRPITLPSASPGAKLPLKPSPTGVSDRLTVSIEDSDLCPRYAAAVADVSVAPSPAWMAARLQAAGVRPISSIVDLTNYVLIELGHPMHAFDLSKLAGPEIRVRRALSGEAMTTLDGVERKLEPDMLMIADRDRGQAIAGVMGGGLSEVSGATKTVAFESAYFKPASVRRTSKRLNLKTEASSRFERGADINGPVLALARLAALMEQIGAGRTTGPIIDVYPAARGEAQIHLRRARLKSLLGVEVPDADVMRILSRLGLSVKPAAEGWDIAVPTFRVDLVREIDLIEEVGRHYGFDKLAATFPVATAPGPAPDLRVPRDNLVRTVLRASGLSEAVTFGFIEARAAQLFATAGAGPAVALANPLSAKFDTLRPSLAAGLVDAVAHNRRHGRDDVRLFEIGTRFASDGETRGVGLAWTGLAEAIHWSGGARPVDFFDATGVIGVLCRALGVPVRFEPTREPFLVAGQAASVVCADGPAAGTTVGLIGQVAPAVADARGLPRQDRVLVAELNLDLLERGRMASTDATRPLPRYPFVVRDVSIVVSDALPAEIIRGTIQTAGQHGPAPLVSIGFFDRYQGKGIPEGSVSLSVRLTFQSTERTLTDIEVQESVAAILAALVSEHRATQR